MGVRFVVRSRAGVKVPGEPEFVFDQSRVSIGRGSAADVRIPDRTVSEHHVSVQALGDHFVITDLGSTNGTRLEGQRLQAEAPRRLRDGDRIELGVYVLTFHSAALVREAVSAERTAELARRLLRDAEAARGKQVPAPRVCVVSGPLTGTTIELPASAPRLVIGRAESCQLVLPDPTVASEHAELVSDLEGVLCRALGASPIVVAGHTLLARRLRDGDEIVLGETRLLFEEPVQALLDALKSEPDEPVPPPAAVPERTEVLPEAAPAAAPPSAAGKHAPLAPKRADADLFIYALAAVVLIASVLGLLLLFHAR